MKYHNISKSIIIIFTLTILILGLTSCATLKAEDLFDDARDVASTIADYTLPKDYSEQFAVELMDYQVVSLIGPEENSHIYLVQAPQDIEINIDQLQQARIMDTNDTIDPKQMQVIENRPVTIRGQSVNLIVQDGLNSKNQPYRTATALFEGRNGPALVSISSMVSVWNPDMVDAFLASLN